MFQWWERTLASRSCGVQTADSRWTAGGSLFTLKIDLVGVLVEHGVELHRLDVLVRALGSKQTWAGK